MIITAFNLQDWINENRHLLKPPVGNKCIVDGDFIVMIVAGPNARTDYHFEDGPEWFYQLEGEMLLKLQIDGMVKDVPIKAGEMFYLPPNIPHSPQRMPDSIGLVIERKRLAHEQDALMWFCDKCNTKIYEQFFHLENIETQFADIFNTFYSSINSRTCANCGQLHPAPSRFNTNHSD
jgi:3-hydroxyanthranilate 3,4-dioxygenase